MKNKIKVSLVFTGGLLVGALSTFIILGQVSYLQYRDYFMMGAREQIFIAWELRANRERDLQERVEANLPHLVLALHNDKRVKSAPGAQSVLREVRDFYEMNSLPIPRKCPRFSAVCRAIIEPVFRFAAQPGLAADRNQRVSHRTMRN